ncbi:hypothetical protein YT1_p20016 (plasmid) [Rhodococcus ruber]|nr:hypothetical protein YT1_p20016 [Rhodococcus ruber]
MSALENPNSDGAKIRADTPHHPSAATGRLSRGAGIRDNQRPNWGLLR